MEIGLKNTDISCYNKVYSGNISREESAESVVPDVMPDIAEILNTNASVYLRSKELAAGKISLSGIISASVLYISDGDDTLRKINVEMPFSLAAEAAAITEQALSTAEIHLNYIETRAANPRKVNLRAGISARVDCYAEETLSFGSRLNEDCTLDVYTKEESIGTDLICGVWEKTFILTDEYPLAVGKSNAQELLGHCVELTAEDVKFVGTKMIFKGMLKTDILWLCEDGSINSSVFSSSFSQIMELGLQCEAASAQLSLMLTGAYLELMRGANDSRLVSAELHILAQATCTQRREITYISDAYSNSCTLTQQHEETMALHTLTPVILRDNMRGLIETPYQVRDVLQILPEIGQWSMTGSGFSCPINVKLLLRDDEGVLHGLVRSFMAKWELEQLEGNAHELQNVSCAEMFATPAAGGVELRMQAQAFGLKSECINIVPVKCITVNEDSKIDLSVLPSVVVLPQKNTDLWELAKRYHSTVELIESANACVSGNIMLIPRAR